MLGTWAAAAQKLPEKGVPALQNFSPLQYQNKGKIWDIRSATNGIVYMAADEGLLEFDGYTWHCYPGSNGFTRSVLPINDSLLYTGSDLDFGVWRKNQHQAFEYTSLYPFREDAGDVNEEFWDVHRRQDDILFVSSQNVYIYNGSSKLRSVPAPHRFAGSFQVGDSLFLADQKAGLFRLDGTRLQQVLKFPENANYEISGIYENESGRIIVTKNAGLFQWSAGLVRPLESPLSQILKTAQVFCFERIDDAHLAFGTVLKGLFITDLNGTMLHHLNKYKGLPNNTVLSLHHSPAGQLWVGTDYGVSNLHLDNNLTYFYDYRGDFGTGYAALLKDGVFYLGTNQGLYRSRWDDLNNSSDFIKFQLVPGSEGQVWSLQNIDDRVLVGHDRGLMLLEGNALQWLGRQNGVWTMLRYREYLLTGNYNGISIYKKSEKGWFFWKKMDLILGSCNQILTDSENVLWVNIPNYGIIRAELDEQLNPVERSYFKEHIFEGSNPRVIKKGYEIQVVTDKKRYVYDAAQQQFIPIDSTLQALDVEALLPGIYEPISLRSDYDFYPVYNGFALDCRQKSEKPHSYRHTLVLRKIEAFNNEHKLSFHPGATIPFRLRNLSIECLIPNREHVLYQYKLNNSEWSEESPEHIFEFFGLNAGAYRLSVRAIINGEFTTPYVLYFRIDTPWYRSWYAWVVYVLLALVVLYAVRRSQKTTLLKQKKQLLLKAQASLREQAEKHRHHIMQLEQERLQKEYEQLKLQLKNKTVELANKAKDSEDKNRLLLTLKEKLEDAQANPSKSKIRWNEMQSLLDSYLASEDKTFEIQMDELHQEFFRKLKEKFPGLSNQDLRLCAYLKIGLNTKEIAEILNILPSSAFITRSRLRKKLNLPEDQDLHTFLNSL